MNWAMCHRFWLDATLGVVPLKMLSASLEIPVQMNSFLCCDTDIPSSRDTMLPFRLRDVPGEGGAPDTRVGEPRMEQSPAESLIRDGTGADCNKDTLMSWAYSKHRIIV